MTGTSKATKAAARPSAATAAAHAFYGTEEIDARIERLRKEKDLLELELEVAVLRRRAADMPDVKTF